MGFGTVLCKPPLLPSGPTPWPKPRSTWAQSVSLISPDLIWNLGLVKMLTGKLYPIISTVRRLNPNHCPLILPMDHPSQIPCSLRLKHPDAKSLTDRWLHGKILTVTKRTEAPSIGNHGEASVEGLTFRSGYFVVPNNFFTICWELIVQRKCCPTEIRSQEGAATSSGAEVVIRIRENQSDSPVPGKTTFHFVVEDST